MFVSQFQLIGIIGKIKNLKVVETLIKLSKFLTELKQPFLIDHDIAGDNLNLKQNAADISTLSSCCDLIIVIGGDGSMLQAARSIINDDILMVGINRGRVGFLTDINPSQLEKIKPILAGKYTIEERFLLSAKISLNNKILGEADALNEVALIPDAIPHMNEVEIYIDNKFVCSQNSDGVIIATPTGSTAYALSGGGPILHPQLDALVIVPIFPHTLSLRPIVIDGNGQIDIVITQNNRQGARISCDGHALIDTPPGSKITINKKPKRLRLIHPDEYDYYETLRSKLQWGQKLRYDD